MPLRDELSADVAAMLTPSYVRRINAARRLRGCEYPEHVVEELVRELTSASFDYEVVLGQWEARYLADPQSEAGVTYHGLYAWLAEAVSLILYRRQVSRRDAARERLAKYGGLVALARANAPLWIFSLNHDVLVECIAALFGLPVCSGFSSRVVKLPCRSAAGPAVANLRGQVLSEAEMAAGALHFFSPGSFGANLLKIRGALDIFVFSDDNDLLKLAPDDPTFDTIVDALRLANEGLVDAALAPDPLTVTNQIPYIDDQGTLRVLRRTLLASAARLGDRCPQLLQRRFLEYFRANLGWLDRLVSLGYELGDDDVNQILRDWLAASPRRHLEIVAPQLQAVPAVLQPLGHRITLTASSATAFLGQFR